MIRFFLFVTSLLISVHGISIINDSIERTCLVCKMMDAQGTQKFNDCTSLKPEDSLKDLAVGEYLSFECGTSISLEAVEHTASDTMPIVEHDIMKVQWGKVHIDSSRDTFLISMYLLHETQDYHIHTPIQHTNDGTNQERELTPEETLNLFRPRMSAADYKQLKIDSDEAAKTGYHVQYFKDLAENQIKRERIIKARNEEAKKRKQVKLEAEGGNIEL
jgi:hypothetical protein